MEEKKKQPTEGVFVKKMFFFASWFLHLNRFPYFRRTAHYSRTVIFSHRYLFLKNRSIPITFQYVLLKWTFQTVIAETTTLG